MFGPAADCTCVSAEDRSVPELEPERSWSSRRPCNTVHASALSVLPRPEFTVELHLNILQGIIEFGNHTREDSGFGAGFRESCVEDVAAAGIAQDKITEAGSRHVV